MSKRKIAIFYIVFIFVFIISCIVRLPRFEKTAWTSSDTNYQCLMNVMAMEELKGKVDISLPLITFADQTDLGIEYSSGAKDKNNNGYFYYISFPKMPFKFLFNIYSIFHLDINEYSLYVISNILFLISAIFNILLFGIIFKKYDMQANAIFLVGGMYIFSTEIMHSMGLLYWGHSLYMVFFPLLCIFLLLWKENQKVFYEILVVLTSFVLLQTEWSAYFVVTALLVFFIYKVIKYKKQIYRRFLAELVACVLVNIFLYVFDCIRVVGFHNFVSVMRQRFVGRTRITDYTIKQQANNVFNSFGILIIILFVFCIIELYSCIKNKKEKTILIKSLFENRFWIFFFAFPLLENALLVNHAQTYSMDRMKWFYVLCLLIMIIYMRLKEKRDVKVFSNCVIATCLLLNLFGYSFVNNSYRWIDERLENNKVMVTYLEKYLDDSVMGQSGINGVWGYSKILFDKGIYPSVDIEYLKEQANYYGKKYAILLNDYDVCYTQKWYSSAIIYNHETKTYKIVGNFSNQYVEKKNDLYYLKFAESINIYNNNYDELVTVIEFDEDDDLNAKLSKINEWIMHSELNQSHLFYSAETKEIPQVVVADNQTSGVWDKGVDVNSGKIIFVNTIEYQSILSNAKYISDGETIYEIQNVENIGDFIYVTVIIDSNNILKFKYPNTIEIITG